MVMNEEEYEEKILKEAGELVDEFQKRHGFGDEDMVRLLEDVFKEFKTRKG